jgi:hypothetical protein
MDRIAEWAWGLPEWAHVLLWFFTRRVPAQVWFMGYLVAYRWQYFDHLHKNA